MATGHALPTIKIVGSSQPTIIRSPSPSRRSAAVSSDDDYYSLPDTESSGRSRATVLPYRTPPSRNISPSLKDGHGDEHQRLTALADLATTTTEDSSPSQVPVSNRHAPQNTSTDRPLRANSSLTTGVDDTPFVQFAIEQLTRDEELKYSGRNGSVASTEYPVERVVAHEGHWNNTTANNQDLPKEDRRHSLPRHSTASGLLIPADSAEDLQNCPPLDYIPASLRPISLAILNTLCLSMIAGLAFCEVWSRKHGGIWDYDEFGGSRYFVFQYLPQILAIIIIVWTFVVQAAVYRIAPLYILATSRRNQGVLQNLPMHPRNFLLPDTSHFRHGERTVGVCLFVMWLTNVFAIPLQSCLFQVRFYGSGPDGGFRWTAVQGVAWTLVSLYSLLSIALAVLMTRFVSSNTGLIRDPVSIADIIPLIQHSNVLPAFHRSEVAFHVGRHISLESLRLGYWWDSSRTQIHYTIGKEGKSLDQASAAESQEHFGDGVLPDADVEQQCLNAKGSFEKALHSPFSRCRWVPWFLRDTFVVAWVALVSVLTIAFVIASFVKHPILKGFLPLLPTLASDTGFSSSNFLYSFIPSFIGTVVFLAWQPIDVYFRAIQSYADLSSPDGASGETSLLLRYNSCLPFEVTFSALAAGHYKVAYISFISIASSVIPVLAGGVFLARSYAESNEIRMSAHLPAYYTLMAFVILYALSCITIWPRRKRYLPHPLVTYADVISFLYQSPLLTDDIFGNRKTKADPIKGEVVLSPGANERVRYSFGIYRGLDGQEHLGIDHLGYPDAGGY